MCWDEDIDWPRVLVLVAMASDPKVVKAWWLVEPGRDQWLDRKDMTRSFDLANLNKSSSHLIWCDVVAATSRAADQYEDALQVATAGDRQTASRFDHSGGMC